MTAASAPAAGPEHQVVFLVFDGVKLLDVSGPAEVFAEANQAGARYALTFVSPSGRDVETSVGTRLPVSGAADAVQSSDTVVVAGGDRLPVAPVDAELRDAAHRLARGSGRVAAICTGSFVLAAAGVLDGRRATTHWRHAALLARAYPSIAVEPDVIFVKDGPVYTSAGVSAGIDLALALVEADHGPDPARQVARSLVVYMQRPGGQTQYSAPLRTPVPRLPTLRAVVDLVAADPGGEHTAASLAAVAGVSPRHLARLFAAELDTSPAKYVERVRLDAARSLLDAGHSVTRAARLARVRQLRDTAPRLRRPIRGGAEPVSRSVRKHRDQREHREPRR